MNLRYLIIYSLPFLLSGCASLVSNTSWPVSINSSSPEATFSITDKSGREVFKGAVPATVNLKSGRGYFKPGKYSVIISSPGFTSMTLPVKAKLNGWYFSNLIYGGVIGLLIVDPITGAMYKIKDPLINQALSPSTSNVEELKIINIADLGDGFLKYLDKIE
jgi:hypothetical protein